MALKAEFILWNPFTLFLQSSGVQIRDILLRIINFVFILTLYNISEYYAFIYHLLRFNHSIYTKWLFVFVKQSTIMKFKSQYPSKIIIDCSKTVQLKHKLRIIIVSVYFRVRKTTFMFYLRIVTTNVIT